MKSCTTTLCQEGYHCENGQCVLNGNTGPLQVTLRWNTNEDVDLHLIEPHGTGSCEIYYDAPNTSSAPSSCGAVGSLDLDSEPACPFPPDNIEVENIIYPPGLPAPSGTYIVRVDHYQNCDSSLVEVPFQIEIRINGQVTGLCGVFRPTDADWNTHGVAGAGRTVMTFNIP